VPCIHSGAMNLFFLLPKFLVFLFVTIDLREQLEGTSFLRPELKNILESLTGMALSVVVDVLPRKSIPVIDLSFAAPVFNSAFQGEGNRVVRLDLQGFLQLLQS